MITTKRPMRSDDFVIKKAAELMLPDFLEWLGEDAQDTEYELKTLIEVFDRAFDFDGYEMAKLLDEKHYGSNTELVDVMSNAYRKVDEAHRNAVSEWIRAYNIQPQLAVGDVVPCSRKVHGQPAQELSGEITAIDTKQAKYTIFVASLGHVKEGLGTHGFVVPFEDIEQ